MVGNDILESLIELAIVQEHVGVVVPPVEVALDGLDGLDDTVQLLVPGENDKGAIRSRFRRVGFQAPRHEHLVMLLADFSAKGGNKAVSKGSIGKNRGLEGESAANQIGFCLPNSWRCPGGHEDPAGGAGMPDEQD